MFEGMAGYPPTKDDARRVPLKTLVLHGGEDPLVSAADVDNFCQWIEDVEGITYPDCGHTLPLEEPLRFMQTLSQFLEKLPHP